ncbi:response regulator [Nitrospina gracilis]|nr:response regulator [Nitrospina gracilis]
MSAVVDQKKTQTVLRLLMVEESTEDALLLACALRDGGYQPQCERVETVEAMTAALEKQKWDLVISDYSMTRFDGLKVISTLKSQGTDIPIIIVSNSIDKFLQEKLIKAGASEFVLKNNLSSLIPILEKTLPPMNQNPKTDLKPKKIDSILNDLSETRNIELLDAKVLIVDDEPKNVEVIKQVMEMAGYENIRFTCDPREVCGIYKSFWPDLVLLDLNMPHMNGFEVMEELKKVEQRDYVPVLVLTAQTDRESRLKALRAGAKDFLLKPFDLVEVIHRIQNMLEVRLIQNKLRNQNFNLEEKVQERTKELYRTQLSIVQRLGRAAEYRDNETGNHVLRMSRVAALLAKHMGFDEKHCELVLNAAPMHDVGKIGIPDGILLKPGKHDSEEWGVMRTHAEIGYHILADDPSELMQLAARIALEHHEKWDGSGYPNGLKGEGISIEARITTVSDVFDALTSERPYKRAWSVEDAVKFIEEQKGVSFDSKIVEKFKEVLPEIILINKQYLD